MYLLMKTRLVSMGNSRGVRLPKPLIEQVGLVDEVEISVENGAIVIAPLRTPRSGWAEAAARLRAEDADGLIDPVVRNRFDEDEWRW
jgi:antitoxin MazE